jgi:hypothetical protein
MNGLNRSLQCSSLHLPPTNAEDPDASELRSPKTITKEKSTNALARATKQKQPRSQETTKHDPDLAKGPNKNESMHDYENQKFCTIKMNKIHI